MKINCELSDHSGKFRTRQKQNNSGGRLTYRFVEVFNGCSCFVVSGSQLPEVLCTMRNFFGATHEHAIGAPAQSQLRVCSGNLSEEASGCLFDFVGSLSWRLKLFRVSFYRLGGQSHQPESLGFRQLLVAGLP